MDPVMARIANINFGDRIKGYPEGKRKEWGGGVMNFTRGRIRTTSVGHNGCHD